MIDNLQPEQTNETNVVFLEERAVHQETTLTDIPKVLSPSTEAEISEDIWFAKQQLKKPILIQTIQWTTTDTRAKILTSFDFPEVLTTLESLATRTLRMYAYYKMTPIFRYQLNGTQFHQGQIICTFDPFHQAKDPEPLAYFYPMHTLTYATGLPNIKIMASESDPVEQRLPWIHPLNYFTTNSSTGFEVLGRIRVQVLNPLQAATGANNSLSLSIWMYATDAEVHVPIYDHDLELPSYRRLKPKPKRRQKHRTLDSEDESFEELSLLSDVTSAGTSLFNQGSNLIGNVVTGNFGQALKTGSGLISSIRDIIGLDYPVRPIQPDNTIQPVENMAVGRGATRSHRLALDATSLHELPSEIYGNPIADMNILEICRTPMLLQQFTWSTSDPPETAIFKNLAVTPNMCGGTKLGASYFSESTYLAFFSKFFGYWRGSIEYTFEIVATHFHSGKLILGFTPNATSHQITFDHIARSLPSTTFDIQQTSKFTIAVPFVSSTGLKATRNPKASNTGNDSVNESITGYIDLFVLNQLACAPNVANSVEINVYINAGSDFGLYVPRDPAIKFQPFAPPPEESTTELLSGTSIELQVDRSTDQKKMTTAILTLGSGVSTPVPRFGESYSAIDMIRRYVEITPTNLVPSINQYEYIVHPAFMVDNPADIPKDQPTGLIRALAQVYSAWTGSLRYKFMLPKPRTTQVMLRVAHYFDNQFMHSSAPRQFDKGYAFTATTLSQNNCVEVDVPYYSLYNMLLIRPDVDDTDFTDRPIYNGKLVVEFDSNDTQEDPGLIKAFIAAGEDFKFLYLRSPPADYDNGTNTFQIYTNIAPPPSLT